ncbi:hypothetical protein ASF53_09240 [Methylobacterium sp. Leaf123]|uniref:hypothetical protein n=1 Tax=Methylobacterium sp. Leaf123 TaxID=1736264 RepID=UPI0006FA2618|nr:hypothetical protein [Methylobacterium sp. Leaf123]KQQ14791.1 hypothetical protein ASF53_09240 [Methylobacterium sp. Leaf123]
MAVLVYLRTRILIWQARHHAEEARRLWLTSEAHHRRAGECLDRLESEIAAGRLTLVHRP